MLTLDRPTETLNDFDLSFAPLAELDIPFNLDETTEEPIICESVSSISSLELWSYESGLLAAQEVRLFALDLIEDQSVNFRAWAQADIDVYVLDPYGQMVAYDNSDGGRPKCNLQTPISGEYLVKLVNNAGYAVDYRMYVSSDKQLVNTVTGDWA